MQRPERMILVTGAPRGGTTPVGDLLSRLSRARMVYEPMGPNGDLSVPHSFAFPKEPEFELGAFVDRLMGRKLRMGQAKRRASNSAKMALVYRLLGTQAQHSYRLFRYDPFVRTLIWKDPFATFCAEHGAAHNYQTVMTIRPPLAHAASFKRIGWTSRVAEVYPRYAKHFGPLPGFEEQVATYGASPLGSGALMWRLIHDRFAKMPKADRQALYLLDMEALGADEVSGYDEVFGWLGVKMPARARALIAKRAQGSAQQDARAGQVHDFERSAKATNVAWKGMLTEEEIGIVKTITGDLWDLLPCDNR